MDTGQGKEVQLSDNKALVEEYEAVLSYPNTRVPEAIVYDSWTISEVREEIHRAGLDDNKKVKKLDRLDGKNLRAHQHRNCPSR